MHRARIKRIPRSCFHKRPANSSQQPTTCRSLARRFRASFCATLRVALPESEGTWRLSERTLCRPGVHSEERSNEESLVQRALNGRSATDGASCAELAAVDDAGAA